MGSCRAAAVFLVAGCAALPLAAAEKPVEYAHDVKPILREHCATCHGALEQKAELRLDAAQLIRKGGESGVVVVPGDLAKSLLVERITSTTDDRMPPEEQGKPLTPEEIAVLKAWIEQGAKSPAEEAIPPDPRLHWAFQRPVRPALPQLPGGAEAGSFGHGTAGNPIDAFIAAEHAKRGLTARPQAEKPVLLRRIYLDLVGFPPTRDELHEFLADDSPDAYERVVERLLASPQYGARWGRHWMDVWRYSDWFGRRMVPDVWNSAPQIWRWRDWIVRSLNDDHGYDRMIREMLAADELAPEDDATLAATGFLIRNWYALNPNEWMRLNVEHTAKAFLGLTFNCAHCHDHKYDPITQEDYFRLRACFEPLGIRQDRLPGEADPGPFQEYSYSVLRKIVRLGTIRAFDKNPEAPTWFYTGGDERNRVTKKGSISPGVPAFLSGAKFEIKPVELGPRARYPGLRPAIAETMLADLRSELAKAEAELAAAKGKVDERLPALRELLTKAEDEFAAAVAAAEKAGRPGALAGKHSVLFDATTGRRIIQTGLPSVKTLEDGSVLRFELLILQDAHFNFQLAKDSVKGLTAGYVAFEKGRILSYQPGSFTEFETGKYEFSAGQTRFDVALEMQTKADRCLLTVKLHGGGKTLVDAVPVALNGWNPVGDPTKGISFDARPGSIAALDEVALFTPAITTGGSTAAPVRVVHFGFEAPVYPEGRDPVGIEGWTASSFGELPATSLISATTGSPDLREAVRKRDAARRAVEARDLPNRSADAKKAAALANIRSVEARLHAERAKYGDLVGVDAVALTRAAVLVEREAAIKSAESAVLAGELAHVTAEAKPPTDAKRAAELQAAATQLSAARTALDKARALPADPPSTATYSPLSPVYAQRSTGRRTALAEWIASPANPLTARVAVNHIWLRHFHAPLVPNVWDFGTSGAPPSHPALLDWLAVELVESGWSTKHLHRLMVTSQAYRRVSSAGPRSPLAPREGALHLAERDGYKVDPENRFLWRMNVGRMEAEAVRDSLLSCADRLDLQLGGQELENTEALTTRRRTLYYSCHPEEDGKSQFGKLFDGADAAECYRRSRSVVPQQALALTNSDLVHDLSAAVAAKLWAGLSQKESDKFIAAAYEHVLSRAPTAREVETCLEFLTKQLPPAGGGNAAEVEDGARESLVRVLLNHNDFITIR